MIHHAVTSAAPRPGLLGEPDPNTPILWLLGVI